MFVLCEFLLQGVILAFVVSDDERKLSIASSD